MLYVIFCVVIETISNEMKRKTIWYLELPRDILKPQRAILSIVVLMITYN